MLISRARRVPWMRREHAFSPEIIASSTFRHKLPSPEGGIANGYLVFPSFKPGVSTIAAPLARSLRQAPRDVPHLPSGHGVRVSGSGTGDGEFLEEVGGGGVQGRGDVEFLGAVCLAIAFLSGSYMAW